MIVKSHEADRYVASPPKGLTVALVYGPDAGLVQERAEKLLKSVVPDLTDPFNVVGPERKRPCWPIRRGWRTRPPPFP